MFFPISDDDRALYKPCYVTWALLAANLVVFLYQLGNEAFTYGFAAIPAEITGGKDLVEPILLDLGPGKEPVMIPQAPGPSPIFLTLLTSMFMHAGWMHLLGNMLFLFIFGDNVEHRFGPWRFLLFYLVSGIAASFAQIATGPGSVIPSLGASGAISGVLGAYLVLFPHNKVYAVVFFSIMSVPAFLVIVMWAVIQFINGIGAFAVTAQTGGVAYAAHIGGFVAGILLGWLCRMKCPEEPETPMRDAYRRDPRDRQLW